MNSQHIGHSVILFPASEGGWCFAEVDGASVYRFGPFESRQAADELLSVLFPEVPRVELSDSSGLLDDSALMIRANAELMGRHRNTAAPITIDADIPL